MAKQCECDIMDRVIQLEQVQGRHGATLYGDDEKPGLVGQHREISWKLNLLIGGVMLLIGAFAVAFANGVWNAATSHQVMSQTVGSGDGVTPSAEYDTKQLAGLMGYSVREVQDRAAKGEIPGARKDGKEWRFDRAAVDAALAAKTAKAADAAKP